MIASIACSAVHFMVFIKFTMEENMAVSMPFSMPCRMPSALPAYLRARFRHFCSDIIFH